MRERTPKEEWHCVIQVFRRLPPNLRCSLETPSGSESFPFCSFEIALETSSISNSKSNTYPRGSKRHWLEMLYPSVQPGRHRYQWFCSYWEMRSILPCMYKLLSVGDGTPIDLEFHAQWGGLVHLGWQFLNCTSRCWITFFFLIASKVSIRCRTAPLRVCLLLYNSPVVWRSTATHSDHVYLLSSHSFLSSVSQIRVFWIILLPMQR